MVKRRFNKTQIQKILQKYEEGSPIHELIEECGISQATFYNWKSKYGNLSYNSSQELLKLKEDNERLKRMFADLSLENLSLRTQLEKQKKQTN